MKLTTGQRIRLPSEGDYREVDGAIPERGLATDDDTWIVSLELAAMNQAVYEAIHPDRAGFDAVVFDECIIGAFAEARRTVGDDGVVTIMFGHDDPEVGNPVDLTRYLPLARKVSHSCAAAGSGRVTGVYSSMSGRFSSLRITPMTDLQDDPQPPQTHHPAGPCRTPPAGVRVNLTSVTWDTPDGIPGSVSDAVPRLPCTEREERT